jgi:hypothetical protein
MVLSGVVKNRLKAVHSGLAIWLKTILSTSNRSSNGTSAQTGLYGIGLSLSVFASDCLRHNIGMLVPISLMFPKYTMEKFV